MMQVIRLSVAAFLCLAGLAPTLPARGNIVSGEVVSVDADKRVVRLAGELEYKVSEGDLPMLAQGAAVRGERVKFGKAFRLEHIWPNAPETERTVATAQRRLRLDTVTRGHKVYRAVGETLPRFALYNQKGELVLPRDWRGRNVVINFIFTRCQAANMCPASTQRMIELQEAALAEGLENFHLVTISFDPNYDSPGVLNQYAINRGIDTARHDLLTGPEGMIDDLLRQFGIVTINADNTIDHTMATLIVDGRGRIAYRKDGSQWSGEDFLKRLKHMEHGE